MTIFTPVLINADDSQTTWEGFSGAPTTAYVRWAAAFDSTKAAFVGDWSGSNIYGLRCSVWDASSGKPTLVGTASWQLPMAATTSTKFYMRAVERSDDTHVVCLYEATDTGGIYDVYVVVIELQNGTTPVFGTPVKWLTASDYVPAGGANPAIVNNQFLLQRMADGKMLAGSCVEYTTDTTSYIYRQQIATRILNISGTSVTLGPVNAAFDQLVDDARVSGSAFPAIWGSGLQSNGNVTAFAIGQNSTGSQFWQAYTWDPTGAGIWYRPANGMAAAQVFGVAANTAALDYDYLRVYTVPDPNVDCVRLMVQSFNVDGNHGNGWVYGDIYKDGSIMSNSYSLIDPHSVDASWVDNWYGGDISDYWATTQLPSKSGGMINGLFQNTSTGPNGRSMVEVGLFFADQAGNVELDRSGLIELPTKYMTRTYSPIAVMPDGAHAMIWSPALQVGYNSSAVGLTVMWWQIDVAGPNLDGYLGPNIRRFQT